MAGNSLESVLAWMKDSSPMLNWGLIVAVERRKANLLIIQEYIQRFGEGSYLPTIKGEVPIVEDQWMEYVHDFVLDVPRLSFENADLNDSKAMLSMAVMGGSQITLKKESVGWKADKVDEIDPLQGPKLYLDLLLNQVPGDVDVDGRIKLDLSQSDNFRLTFGQTPHEQRMGGDFFKDLFNQLPDEKRIYPLGTIQHGTNELMNAKSFELRTQASSSAARDPRSAEYGEGAILALIRTMGRNGGNFPGAGYKYLIPDDQDKEHSATVLLDAKPVLMSSLINALGAMTGCSDFKYEFDEYGKLVSATALGGGLSFLGKAHSENYSDPDYEWGVEVLLGFEGLKALAVDVLVVEVKGDNMYVNWKYRGEGVLYGFAKTAPIQKISLPVPYVFSLEIIYSLTDEDGILGLKKISSDIEANMEWPDLGGGALGLPISYWGLLQRKLRELVEEEDLDLLFESMLGASFPLDISVIEIVGEAIKLNFGQVIQGDEVYGPSDIGFFGRINPTQTSFVVSPMEPLLKQGSTQQFTTDPVVPGVQWKVENLVEGPGNPGIISASGLYQAPTEITGRYTRVRVTATAPGTGYFSSALVTVVANELTVNPLIQTCSVGATVELSAGQLGTGALTWSIKNPVPGESGEVRPSDKPEGDHTYHHGPVVADKTFVLDEIEVKSAAGATRSMHVLALQKSPGLTVSIDSFDPVKGQVQLKAIVNGGPMDAEWSLPLGGPGTIDATGLYRAAPTSTERFALIFALVDGGPFGKFEGYLILPLPLVEFPKLLEVLSQ
jgi:hypothetical protein